MLLTFSKTQFRDRIRRDIKVHTIREDKHSRWQVGNKVHFWLGNPRNKKNNPYQFGVGEVSRVERIHMIFANEEDCQHDVVYIGNDIMLRASEELHALAINDGFDNWEEMKSWFMNDSGQYVGRIIFWKRFELTANDDGSTVF